MLWNVESDDPGMITRIEMIDKDGNNAVNEHGHGHWDNMNWYNISFTTFTVQGLGLSLTSVIDPGGGVGDARMQCFAGRAGETITLRGTLTVNSGELPQIRLYKYDGTFIDNEVLAEGDNVVSFTLTEDSAYYLDLSKTDNAHAVNFSFTSVSFETENFINHFQNGEDVLYDMVNNGYDTHTQIASGTPNVAIVKSTAVGEARSAGMMTLQGTGGVYGYTNRRVRIDLWLTLNAGDAPKIELRDSATFLVTQSNTITLAAGRNTFILTPTINTGAATKIIVFNEDGETTNFSIDFAEAVVDAYEPELLSDLTDEYFQYNGNTLNWLLPTGQFYLRMDTIR